MTPSEQKAFDQMREALKHGIREMNLSGKAKECMPLHQALTAANAVSHPKPETAPATEGGAITSESDHFPDATKMMHPFGWYCVSRDGMATLCANKRDAEKTAKSANRDWPNSAPYRAVQLCEYAHPQATEPAGYKLVPVEPTPAMLYAIQNDCDILPPRGRRIWAAMLAAAPEAKQ